VCGRRPQVEPPQVELVVRDSTRRLCEPEHASQ